MRAGRANLQCNRLRSIPLFYTVGLLVLLITVKVPNAESPQTPTKPNIRPPLTAQNSYSGQLETSNPHKPRPMGIVEFLLIAGKSFRYMVLPATWLALLSFTPSLYASASSIAVEEFGQFAQPRQLLCRVSPHAFFSVEGACFF